MGIFGSKQIRPLIFSLKNNKKTFDTKESCSEEIEKIKKSPEITIVCLSGNTFGIDASKNVSETLKLHKSIETIDVSDIFTGRLRSEIPLSIKNFADLFISLENLKEVDLSDNAFGPDCATQLKSFISTAYSLVSLKIKNCGLGPTGGKMIADSLIKLGKNKKDSNLRTLVIDRNRLENEACFSFKEVFVLHNLVEELSISQNGIRPEGIVSLLKGLKECSNLKKLDIQDNTFSDLGAEEFNKTFCKWKNLSYLDVSDCLIPKKNIKEIISSLIEVKQKLCYLGLQYCNIDDEIGLRVSELISSMDGLNTLKLNGNCFSCNGKAAEKIRNNFNSFCDTSSGLGIDEWDEMEDSSSIEDLEEDVEGLNVEE